MTKYIIITVLTLTTACSTKFSVAENQETQGEGPENPGGMGGSDTVITSGGSSVVGLGGGGLEEPTSCIEYECTPGNGGETIDGVKGEEYCIDIPRFNGGQFAGEGCTITIDGELVNSDFALYSGEGGTLEVSGCDFWFWLGCV